MPASDKHAAATSDRGEALKLFQSVHLTVFTGTPKRDLLFFDVDLDDNVAAAVDEDDLLCCSAVPPPAAEPVCSVCAESACWTLPKPGPGPLQWAHVRPRGNIKS